MTLRASTSLPMMAVMSACERGGGLGYERSGGSILFRPACRCGEDSTNRSDAQAHSHPARLDVAQACLASHLVAISVGNYWRPQNGAGD